MARNKLLIGLLMCCPMIVIGGELTFELPDNEKMCFYEEIEAGKETTLEFQVGYSIFLF